MSSAKPKPKAGATSVSKPHSTNTATTSKTSALGVTSSSSKSDAVLSVKSKEQLQSASRVAKEPVIFSSAKPSQFYFACRNNEIETVRSVLPKLTLKQINQIEPNGSTALHAATYYGHEKIVKLLLSNGAERMIKNLHGCTPLDEAQSDELKRLFRRVDERGTESQSRFSEEKGPSFEWIFVRGDPSSYASFNRRSLLKCENTEEFQRLCQGIRKYYINENGPLDDVKHIEEVRSFFDRAIEANDPRLIVRAYTAETGFYHRLNQDLSQLPTHWSGSKHERNIASMMLFHPVFADFWFTGVTYRGFTMSADDLKEYVVDSVFMNKTFLSTARERRATDSFIESKGSPSVFVVVCTYITKHQGTALAIEDLSEYPDEKEVLILPYAAFKVKSISQSTRKSNQVIEIVAEEEDSVKWTLQKSYKSSQTHSSVKKTTGAGQDSYEKMFKDSQEKGSIDPADLAKWKQESFGIDSENDTYGKIWSDAKKGKYSKSDLAKWKKEAGVVSNGGDPDDSDIESIDGENNPNVFTASNEQSYATSKTISSSKSMDMDALMKQLENDSDD